MRIHKSFVLFCGVIALLFGGLLLYAETRGFAWDEGFHLMAARLMKEGKTPYLDFCFAQTPLNAYWNAFWLRIFGDSWRAIHAITAVFVAGAVLLTADFIRTRFPVAGWRTAGAMTALFLAGLNGAVVLFGAVGQAYGICLFLTVAAFRIALVAVDRQSPLLTTLAGLCAGAAADSSLLTAPVVPVLLVWMFIYNRAGNRLPKLAAFVVAVAIPFLPVAWLFLKSPHLVFFDLITYHAHYRHVYWEGATQHDFEVLLSWIDSGQALLLGLLAVIGLYFIAAQSGWERRQRAEFYLSAWIAALMGLEIATAHPTFWWYFLLVVPFAAIPATAGMYALSSRLLSTERAWPVAVLMVLLALGLVRTLYEDIGSLTWPNMEEIAKKVDQVTPPNGTVWVPESVFFLTHRPLPEGMEFQAAMKLTIPMSMAAPLHILPKPELKRRIQAGAYGTIANCDDDQIKDLGIADLYSKKEEIDDCTVFWDFTPPKPH